MDRFEDMINRPKKVDLVRNLKYALSLQFIVRLEKGEK